MIMTGKKPGSADPGGGGSGQLLIDELGQLGLAQGPHLGRGQLTVFEQHQGGDATDAKFGRDVAVFVHIHFGNLQFALVTIGDIVQDRGNHLARAAPLGPVVHQHRCSRLENIGFKGLVGDVFDEVAGPVLSCGGVAN